MAQAERDVGWFGLLNDYTKTILTEAAKVARRLTDGLSLKVSADSDVVLYRPDGHWVGIRLHEAHNDPRWEGWRGSLFDGPTEWPTLRAAVDFYAKARGI